MPYLGVLDENLRCFGLLDMGDILFKISPSKDLKEAHVRLINATPITFPIKMEPHLLVRLTAIGIFDEADSEFPLVVTGLRRKSRDKVRDGDTVYIAPAQLVFDYKIKSSPPARLKAAT